MRETAGRETKVSLGMAMMHALHEHGHQNPFASNDSNLPPFNRRGTQTTV